MSDKTVLITGCSSGIGRATAEQFLDEGWTVYATSRDDTDVADLAEQGCRTDTLDVTENEDVARVADRIDDEQGELDCLVNNAGYGLYGPLEDIPAEKLHDQFDVNVYGPHRLTRAALPLLREAEGTICNVSSVQGRLSVPGGGAYSASKFALEAMSDALRAEVDPFDVEVVLVEPGPVETNFQDRAAAESDSLVPGTEYDWVYDSIADATTVSGSLPIAVTPEEVATTIHDAASVAEPDSRYPVERFAKLAVATRFLPDSVRDGIFRLVRRFA
ncbi:Short-chain dehydrogenase [Halovenus aranensis]|uniref:Short-chain dehydrogenase n=1 Tax=Halovenus aranensis TaxID=890420 RepID=A0A1G8XH40_9EURY|nr:SDR family oxidoreductase [Halovenus aranensis]SDJ89717.1 Short-chain dehydrogenase [Halovenus aranensis]